MRLELSLSLQNMLVMGGLLKSTNALSLCHAGLNPPLPLGTMKVWRLQRRQLKFATTMAARDGLQLRKNSNVPLQVRGWMGLLCRHYRQPNNESMSSTKDRSPEHLLPSNLKSVVSVSSSHCLHRWPPFSGPKTFRWHLPENLFLFTTVFCCWVACFWPMTTTPEDMPSTNQPKSIRLLRALPQPLRFSDVFQ